jgi:hypothetical protein
MCGLGPLPILLPASFVRRHPRLSSIKRLNTVNIIYRRMRSESDYRSVASFAASLHPQPVDWCSHDPAVQAAPPTGDDDVKASRRQVENCCGVSGRTSLNCCEATRSSCPPRGWQMNCRDIDGIVFDDA